MLFTFAFVFFILLFAINWFSYFLYISFGHVHVVLNLTLIPGLISTFPFNISIISFSKEGIVLLIDSIWFCQFVWTFWIYLYILLILFFIFKGNRFILMSILWYIVRAAFNHLLNSFSFHIFIFERSSSRSSYKEIQKHTIWKILICQECKWVTV